MYASCNKRNSFEYEITTIILSSGVGPGDKSLSDFVSKTAWSLDTFFITQQP